MAGGPVRNYLISKALYVYVETGDREVGPVERDAMISLLEYEGLINDKLGGELGILKNAELKAVRTIYLLS